MYTEALGVQASGLVAVLNLHAQAITGAELAQSIIQLHVITHIRHQSEAIEHNK